MLGIKINWVQIRELRKEYGISVAVISRWAELGLIKRKAVDQGATKWLYDKDYFKLAFGGIRIAEEKKKLQAFKKWGRKLSAIESEIERGIK